MTKEKESVELYFKRKEKNGMKIEKKIRVQKLKREKKNKKRTK